MQKTENIEKIDQCIIKYIETNNVKNKRSLSSAYMKKDQLKQFYTDMINDGQCKFRKIRQQKQQNITKIFKFQKSTSGPHDVYGNAEVVPMSHNIMISQIAQHNRVKKINTTTSSDDKIDKEDIKVFKKIQEEKYINRFRVKQKKLKLSENNPRQTMMKQEVKGINRGKIQSLFSNFMTNSRSTDYQDIKFNTMTKFRQKQMLFTKIRTYFYKKNKYMPFH